MSRKSYFLFFVVVVAASALNPSLDLGGLVWRMSESFKNYVHFISLMEVLYSHASSTVPTLQQMLLLLLNNKQLIE